MEDTVLTQANIDKDSHLILEAISRLKDGTWNLDDEDSDWANYLLPKVKEALMEHVELESLCVLPLLSSKDAVEHSSDHEKILGLLEGLVSRLRSHDAEEFQISLAMLIETLENHNCKFKTDSNSQTIRCEYHCAEDIAQRSDVPSLGYKP